jgi:hypothetical protein
MDGDGDLDALTALYEEWRVVWYEQPDDPILDPWPERVVSASSFYPAELVRGDFDGDGLADVAVAGVSYGATGQLEILLDDGAGAFASHAYDAYDISSVEAADVDGDGDLDAISTSYDGHRTDWWENLLGIFASGFERGDLLDWTSAVP